MARPSAGQTLVADVEPYVNQYIASGSDTFNDRWWEALSSELVMAIAKPADEIEEVALQNVIFFAQVHGRRLNLKPAVPYLLDVYRDGTNEGARIMALAALHAISNRSAMADLRQHVSEEMSPRVKRLTVAALAEYYR
jgi:hypothetical protein